MEFSNVYEDAQRAAAYATLEYPGTYYLAFRDLPKIIGEHVTGKRALDFGCGTGRSTRFLKNLGFDAVGTDIAADMLEQARGRDPEGDYRLLKDDGTINLGSKEFDVILSAFTFDNIPTFEKKVSLFRGLKDSLTNEGIIVNLVSSPEIYTHEWASFATKDFPENRSARCGDKVKIIMTDVDDRRPVEDILWPDADYREVYRQAELEIVQTHKPLAESGEFCDWISETQIAPWVIYVLRKTIR